MIRSRLASGRGIPDPRVAQSFLARLDWCKYGQAIVNPDGPIHPPRDQPWEGASPSADRALRILRWDDQHLSGLVNSIWRFWFDWGGFELDYRKFCAKVWE